MLSLPPASHISLLLLHSLSLLIVVGFLASALLSSFSSSPSSLLPFNSSPMCSSSSSPSSFSSSTALSPSQSSVATTFRHLPALEDLSPAADAAWDALLTPHGGSVWLRRNATFAQDWGVAMFHGLHCLGLIRVGLRDGLAGHDGVGHGHGLHAMVDDDDDDDGGKKEERRRRRRRRGEPLGGGSHEGHLDGGHLRHCFSYIAQHLMCAGDSTIEPPWEDRDANDQVVLSGVDGMGVTHTCKDTSRMWEVARESEKAPVSDYGRGKFREKDTVEGVWGWSKEL